MFNTLCATREHIRQVQIHTQAVWKGSNAKDKPDLPPKPLILLELLFYPTIHPSLAISQDTAY